MDSANLDNTHGVALVPDRKIALVTSYNLHKLSVFSYEDANNLSTKATVESRDGRRAARDTIT